MLKWTALCVILVISEAIADYSADDDSWLNMTLSGDDGSSEFCYTSTKSGREICYVKNADTSCYSGPNKPPYPQIEHAVVTLMYGVQICDCFEHSVQRTWYSNESVLKSVFNLQKTYYFLQYECEFGYEFLDEAKILYCSKGRWRPETPPKCVGKGACRRNNGGCSHNCLARNNKEIKCSCPEGMQLGDDRKTCFAIQKEELNDDDCVCKPIDAYGTLSCDCPKDHKPIGPPEISILPDGPYEVIPGEAITLSCIAKSFVDLNVHWESENKKMQNETLLALRSDSSEGKNLDLVTKFSKISADTIISCVASSIAGVGKKTFEVLVTEPGSAPQVTYVYVGRNRAIIWWEPPVVSYCPIKLCLIYYTTNSSDPLDRWSRTAVDAFMRVFVLRNLAPSTKYYYRLRSLSDFRSGSYGPQLSFETTYSEPHHEPIILRHQITRNSIKIVWEPPPSYFSRSVQEYILHYSDDLHIPLFLQFTEKASSTDTELVIKNLEPSTDYYLHFRARYHEFDRVPHSFGIFAHYRTA